MSVYNATPGGPVVLTVVVRDASGQLAAATETRYQLRDEHNAVLRDYGPDGTTDFTEAIPGVYVALVTAPSEPGTYLYYYIASLDGVVLPGTPDTVVVQAVEGALLAPRPVGAVS